MFDSATSCGKGRRAQTISYYEQTISLAAKIKYRLLIKVSIVYLKISPYSAIDFRGKREQ